MPEVAPASVPSLEPPAVDERSTGASGMRLKVATRPATVGATWLDLFQPGTPSDLGLEARVRVVADIAGALIQIHENPGVPRQHRRHGRLTPRHVLIGVDGSASLFNAKEPFSKLLPPQPDLGYLAPELLTHTGPATQQSDVFSMGVLLWEALDNGRLFPHRRAAAISRLIARHSLPTPRIEEEWALPLAEVAMRALSDAPGDRHADATALWLALREHLPPPDAARAALSGAAQRALRLELTSDIREAPPYLVRAKPLIGTSAPPERVSLLDPPPLEASARYSLRPEPSSRRPSTPDGVWPSRSSAPPPVDALTESDARITPEPASARTPASTRIDHATSRAATSESVPRRTPISPSSVPLAARTLPDSEPVISTLQVNLPRDLVDTSLPLLVSSRPVERPFPWGALSFAALVFFGVGAAVAFGAVTALRAPMAPAQVSSERQPVIVQAAPAAALPNTPAPTPPVPRAEVPATSTAAAPTAGAPTAAAPTPAPAPETRGTPPPAATEPRDTPDDRAGAAGPKPPKPAKARPKAAKPKTPPRASAALNPEPDNKPAESLPVVEQPY